MPYKVFRGYGGQTKLEQEINQWLQERPKELVRVFATSLRLIIAYNPREQQQGRYSVRLVQIFRDKEEHPLEDRLNQLPRKYQRHQLHCWNDRYFFAFFYDPRQQTPPAQLP